MRRLTLAALVVGALCALGGGAAPSASANLCAISTETKGNYERRTPDNATGPCELPGAVGTKKYVIVKDRGKRLGAEVACAEVGEAQKGNYADSDCTTPVAAGTGAFIKIKVAAGWFGSWSVESEDAEKLPAGISITKLTSAKATIKTKIAGVEVKLNTTVAPELNGFKLEGKGKLTTGGTIKFTKVTTELNGKASLPCTPLGTAGSDATLGTITSKKSKGGIVLHGESGAYVQLLPETGTVATTIYFGEECAIGEEVSLITKKETGRGLVLTDPVGIGSELSEHEFTELSALTELWAINETAEHKATIEAKVAAGLTGTHSGLKWKGTPEEIEVL